MQEYLYKEEFENCVTKEWNLKNTVLVIVLFYGIRRGYHCLFKQANVRGNGRCGPMVLRDFLARTQEMYGEVVEGHQYSHTRYQQITSTTFLIDRQWQLVMHVGP